MKKAAVNVRALVRQTLGHTGETNGCMLCVHQPGKHPDCDYDEQDGDDDNIDFWKAKIVL